MRFRIYQDKYGNFYAKRQVWFWWTTIKEPDYDGGSFAVLERTKEAMLKYLYDTYLPRKNWKKDILEQDFRI